jgi:hypothetical protein
MTAIGESVARSLFRVMSTHLSHVRVFSKMGLKNGGHCRSSGYNISITDDFSQNLQETKCVYKLILRLKMSILRWFTAMSLPK